MKVNVTNTMKHITDGQFYVASGKCCWTDLQVASQDTGRLPHIAQ